MILVHIDVFVGGEILKGYQSVVLLRLHSSVLEPYFDLAFRKT